MGSHNKSLRHLTWGFWFKFGWIFIALFLCYILGSLGVGHEPRFSVPAFLAPPAAPAAPAFPWYLFIVQRGQAFYIEWVRASRRDPISSELERELRRRGLAPLPKPREPEARIWFPIQETIFAHDLGAPLRAALAKRKLNLQLRLRVDAAILPPPFGERL